MKNIVTYIFTFLLFAAASAQVPQAGLAAYYPFCGGAADASGGNIHFTQVTAVRSADRLGRPNAAYTFDGVHSMLAMDSLLALPAGNFSISVWININATLQNSLIVYNGNSRQNGYGLFLSNGSFNSPGTRIGMLFGGYNAIYGPALSTHQWHHVVMTYNTGSMKLYVDNSLAATGTMTCIAPAGKFAAGLNYIDSTNAFSGQIDDIIAYDRELPAGDVQELYQVAAPHVTSSPASRFVASGGNAVFTVAADGDGIGYQWQRSEGNSFINLIDTGIYTGVHTPVLSISNIGFNLNHQRYRCLVNAAQECADTSAAAQLDVQHTGIDPDEAAGKARIFPNPSSGSFTVQLKSIQPDVAITVMNATGQQLYLIPEGEVKEQNRITLDTKGICFVRISNLATGRQTMSRVVLQ